MSKKTKANKYIRHEQRMHEEMLQEIEKKVDSTLHSIESTCTILENELIKIRNTQRGESRIFHHFTELWVKWLEFDIDKYEIDRFAGQEIFEVSPKSVHRLKTMEEFWKYTNIFCDCRDLKWTIRFTKKAKKKVLLWNQTLRVNLLRLLAELAIGSIRPGQNCRIVSEGPCANMVYFTGTIKGTDNLILFAILMDRLPVIRHNKVVQFKYEQYLKVIDVIKRNKNLNISIEQHRNSIKNDPDRWIEPIRDKEGMFICPAFSNSVLNKEKHFVEPKQSSIIYLNLKESNSFIFNSYNLRWESLEVSYANQTNPINPFELAIINKLATATSGAEFIRFIRRIPNFRISLTEEQENLIKSPGNVLAIGRSGTGKTTCSILRLLSTELLFRYSVRDRSKRFSPEDIDRSTVLHTVFVTASPVLTNEVKNFYKKIGEHIKEKIQEKEQKLRENVELIEIDETQPNNIENIENEECIDIENNEENSESDEDEAIDGPTSLEFMRDEDFPLFATVRKIVFMVDAAMKRPFFSRNKEGNVIGSNSKFQWHNELKGALMINKEYKLLKQTEDTGKLEIESSDSDSDYDIETETKHRPVLIKKKFNQYSRQSFRKLSYEVDFSIFSTNFYPKIRAKCPFSALLLWTEISAYIKGSSQSFRHQGYYLPRHLYQNMGRKASMLSVDEKFAIWDFFIEYERWKNREDAYDMQDVINYLLNQITFYGYQGVPIHYMMVDEVQDLTPATLYLLLNITEKQLFFSGDTAQTIAKGVGFRFLDLKSLFSESKLDIPTLCQLTMNFRTHNQILGLANSVVAVLETLFPLTIDKMAKEVSPKDGPMPIVLVSKDVEDLIYVLFGISENKNTEAATEFGCNQVIIVRSQEAKDKLPNMLKHALCLTVFEAKGLEFDDVILYNFFTDSEAPTSMWSQFRNLRKINDFDLNRPKNFEDLEAAVPKLKTTLEANNSNFSLLCTELKHLYVAVTRPKKRLIIFDEDQSNRKPVESYWRHMECVTFTEVNKNEGGQIVVQDFGGNFAQRTTKEEWKLQGLRMFSNKYYEQARKCFEIAGEQFLADRAEAYMLANKATALFAEIESTNTELTATKQKTRAVNKQLKMKRALACNMFIQAGHNFLKVANDSNVADKRRVLREAARCFSSGQAHKKAGEIFRSIELFGQAGEAELAGGNFELAGDLFCLKDEYTRAIEAYKIGMNWDKLVKTIFKYKEQMGEEERQKYIRKYVPAAFEDLLPKLVPESETNYIKQIRSETEKVIEEESEESSNEDSEQEEKGEKNKEIIKENAAKSDEKNLDSEFKHSEVLKTESHGSESFILLSSESSFSLLSENLQDVDADDEWLQVETGSVVDSLDSVINPDGSIASDFSLIGNNLISGQGKLIKTRVDIFIEDTTMRKIIEYVSMFSDEVSTYLKTLRSSSSLVSSQVFSYDWELVSLIDLDEISPEILGLLLDILEEFGMYKLSLIVCNRYNLVERIGRFIVSLAFRYSNLSSLTYASYKLNVKEQVQRAAIAFTALHNVFEMMNPDYLSHDKNCQLGSEVFQGLILLGYWKKVVFLLDNENALAVSWSFSDLNTYARILGVCAEDVFKFEWIPQEVTLDSLQHFIAGMDITRQNPVLSMTSERFELTKRLFRALQTGENLAEIIETLAGTIKSYFSVCNSFDFKENLNILESVSAWSMLMMELKSAVVQEVLAEATPVVFEKILQTTNYILKFLANGKTVNKGIPYLRHCILSPAGVRSIPSSKICLIFPVCSHSILHVSSPILQTKVKISAYPIDLEGQSFLLGDQEINKIFSSLAMEPLSYLIEARRRRASDLSSKLNSLGEIWLSEFVLAYSCYSINTYDYINRVSPKVYNEYLRLKEYLSELKGEETADVYFNKYMFDKNKKKISKVQASVNKLEKEMNEVKSRESLNFINSVLDACKYRENDKVEITESARHALVTYAQVMMNSSESETDEVRHTRLWMVYELCNVSDRLICFIEMLRCRHRPVFRQGKKRSKLSLAYHHALGFADLAVFYKHKCLDSASETILSLLDTVELSDELKIYFIQRAVVYWAFTYSRSVTLPRSLVPLWVAETKVVTENKGKLRIQVLEKVIQYFLYYSTLPIPDFTKEEYIIQLSDCLSVVLTYIQKDQLAADCLKNLQKNSGFQIGKSLRHSHACFKMIEEFPIVKTLIKGTTFEVTHKPFPEKELDEDWAFEIKTIAKHQHCANVLRKCIKAKVRSKPSQTFVMYLTKTGKILSQASQQLLEVCLKYMSELYCCFYRVILFKSLDLHFLLDQMFMLSNYIKEIDTCPATIESINNHLRILENWKIMVKPAGTEQKLKAKKKWNVKWKNRARKVANR